MNSRAVQIIDALKRLAGRLAMILLVPAMTLWMFMAVRFSNLPGSGLPAVTAVIVAVLILAVLAVIKGRWRAVGAVTLLFLLVYGWYLLIPASNDRDWEPPVARLATARFSNSSDSVTIANIRNFNYRTRNDYDIHYYDKTFALEDVTEVDLVVSYWGNEAMAHTFLSFRIGADDQIAISIEIRPEKGEQFDPVAGLFKKFELIYVVADERDLIGLRTNHRAEDTFLYRTPATPEQARILLTDMLQRIQQLETDPAYYGTIQSNCTTSLVSHVNKIIDDDIMFSGRLLFNGFSDKLAYERGNIRQDLPFRELKAACYVSDVAKTLDNDPAFSTKIRAHVRENIAARKTKQ